MAAESHFPLPDALPMDPVDRAIAEAGRIVNNAPRFLLPLPEKIAWFCWAWRVEYGGEVKAEGRAWRERLAYKRRWRAYRKADNEVKADSAGLRDRLAHVEETGCE